MSEMRAVISCTGKITRAELAKLPTPPATATHIPIRHAAVLETMVETVSHRHIGVVGEEFAVSKDEMEMFGVLDLETSFERCRFAIGIRNANTSDSGWHVPGKFAAAKGEGGCTGKANADGTVTWDCEGAVTLAK
jgi:hypothetical protein